MMKRALTVWTFGAVLACGAEGGPALDDTTLAQPVSSEAVAADHSPANEMALDETGALDPGASTAQRAETTSRTPEAPSAEEGASAAQEGESGESAFPVGEQADNREPGSGGGAYADPFNEASSSALDMPGTPDTAVTNDVSEVPNDGWVEPSTPESWAAVAMADYPHVLPERAVALNNASVQPWTSGRGIAEHENMLFVASTEAGSVVVLDRLSGDVQRIVAVGSRPEQVVVAPDGTAFVTLRHSGSVVRIPAGSSVATQSVQVGTEPYGLALSPDAKTLYVTLSGDNRVMALTSDELIPLSLVDVPRRPRGVLAHSSGKVFVTNQFGGLIRIATHGMTGELLGESMETLPYRTQNPADIALHADVKLDKTVATRSFALAENPQDGNVYAVQINANPGSTEQSLTELLNTQQETETTCETTCSKECKQSCQQNCQQVCQNSGGYGGTVCSNSCSTSCHNNCHDVCNTNCVTEILTFPHIIRPIEVSLSTFSPNASAPMPSEQSAPVKDAQTGEPMTSLCDKPMDVQHHPTHSFLFMVCKGTDNLLVMNTASVDPMRSTLAEIKVGQGPTSMTFSADGARAYVRNSQSFTISEIDLTPLFNMASVPHSANASGSAFPNFKQFPSGKVLTQPVNLVHSAELAFAVDPLPEEQKAGRRAFTFARTPGLSQDGFFACGTCHFEGTEDGMIWFVEDGMRQTPMLAQRLHGTAPFNWFGSAESLPKNIHNTVGRMGGSGINEAQTESLVAFLTGEEGLVPPPNPFVNPEGLTASQLAGKQLFYHPSIGCADCHTGESLTDGENWDVGTFNSIEFDLNAANGTGEALALNTPSLRGLHYSAPYFHDGSAEDLYDVLNSTAETMGVTIQLTSTQQDDLVAYLLTL